MSYKQYLRRKWLWKKLRIKYNLLLIANDILELIGDVINLFYVIFTDTNRDCPLAEKLWFALDDALMKVEEQLLALEFELFGYAKVKVRSEELIHDDTAF